MPGPVEAAVPRGKPGISLGSPPFAGDAAIAMNSDSLRQIDLKNGIVFIKISFSLALTFDRLGGHRGWAVNKQIGRIHEGQIIFLNASIPISKVKSLIGKCLPYWSYTRKNLK